MLINLVSTALKRLAESAVAHASGSVGSWQPSNPGTVMRRTFSPESTPCFMIAANFG